MKNKKKELIKKIIFSCILVFLVIFFIYFVNSFEKKQINIISDMDKSSNDFASSSIKETSLDMQFEKEKNYSFTLNQQLEQNSFRVKESIIMGSDDCSARREIYFDVSKSSLLINSISVPKKYETIHSTVIIPFFDSFKNTFESYYLLCLSMKSSDWDSAKSYNDNLRKNIDYRDSLDLDSMFYVSSIWEIN